jgi:hypothetical protein
MTYLFKFAIFAPRQLPGTKIKTKINMNTAALLNLVLA